MRKRIVVKIGSNVLTQKDGLPNEALIAGIADQISRVMQMGIEVILVSSGAVASGRGLIKNMAKTDPVSERQLLAALGQVRLMQRYDRAFSAHQLHCAQVLVTRGDFRDRSHYLNIQNCFNALLGQKVVPIVNENDVVSVTELMFTDNDQLAGLIAAMLGADALFLLTNIDGVMDKPPQDPEARVLNVWEGDANKLAGAITTEKSGFGRGGMLTKCKNALQTARLGIEVTIANGTTPDILIKLCQGEALGTKFPAQQGPSSLKRWLANAADYSKGKVVLNNGAVQALKSTKATSLLPIGIIQIKGQFKKGDLVSLTDENGVGFAVGIAKYGSAVAKKRIGLKKQPPLVHYDYLYLS